jgi:tetratricopeptide (TPR) repeat protein
MSKCGPNTPREEPFEDRIDSLFRELELSIQWQRPSILFAIYAAASLHNDAELALEGRLIDLGQKIFRFQIRSEEDADVAGRLAKVADLQGTVFFVSGLECGGGEDGLAAYAALNKHREFFIDQAIRVVFWLTEDEAVALANGAPDYWAYRHRVIEFVEAPVAERPAASGRPSAAAPEPIAAGPALAEALPADLPVGKDAPVVDANPSLALGLLHWRRGDYEKASRCLRTALETAVTLQDKGLEAECLNALALVYISLGRGEDAIDAYRQAIDLAPDQIFPWNNLGSLYFQLGQDEEAVTAYRKAVEHGPREAVGWYGLGKAQLRLGRLDEAQAAFQKAIELAPKFPQAWNGLGNVLAAAGRTDEAGPAYQKAVELNPHLGGPFAGLGDIALRQGRNEDALQAYRQAVEVDPRSAHGWNGLGNVHFKMGAYDEAIAAYENAVELTPGLGWSYGNLGLAHSAKGQPDQAVPLYLKSIELLGSDKEKAITWNRLGDAYRKLNDSKKAQSAYQKAVELDAALKPAVHPAPLAAPAVADGAPDETSTPETSAPAPAENVDEWRTEIEDKNSLVAAGDDPSRGDPVEVVPSRPDDKSQAAPWDGLEEDPMENELKSAAEWNTLGHGAMSAGNFDEAIAAYTHAIEMAEEMSWPYIQNLARAHYHKGEHKAHSDLPTDAEDAGASAGQEGEASPRYEEPPTQPFPELAVQPGQAGHSLKETAAPEPVPAPAVATSQPPTAPRPDELPAPMGDWLSALEDEKTATVNKSRPLDDDWMEEARRKFGLGGATGAAQPDPEADEVQPQEEAASSLEDTAQMPARRTKAAPVPEPAPAPVEAQPRVETLVDESSAVEPATTWDEDQPRDAMEWNERGNICLKAGACDRAIDAYIKAIESAPDFGWPYSNLGLAYSHKGKYAEAIPLYRKSIELLETKKEKAIAWNRMGDAYRRLNDHKNATAAYQKAVELDSGTSSLLKRVRLSLLGNARV